MTGAAALLPPDRVDCAVEPIHLLGHVQPFGFLLAVTADWQVARASANAGRFLDLPAERLPGSPLAEVLSEHAIHAIRGRLQLLRGGVPAERLFRLVLHDGGRPFDVAVHRSGSRIIIEAEPSLGDSDLDAAMLVRHMVGGLQTRTSSSAFFREAARQMRALTGFDRVMIYRFDHDGAGEVVAETLRHGLPPYLGLRYPATDIPAQARALYERSMIRIIPDVAAVPVPLLPPGASDLDLSFSVLRSVSPIHLEYLRNMGVAASMSVSLLRHGRLWGLVACHHMEPRLISLERRTAAELFGQMFSLMLDSREHEAEVRRDHAARDMRDRLVTAMGDPGASLHGLGTHLDQLREVVSCDGIATLIDGQTTLSGLTPTHDEVRQVARFLNHEMSGAVYATHELGRVLPAAARHPERGAGVLAVPISRQPRDYLMFFRAEVAHTVRWAGNPDKPYEMGPDGLRLSPRKSFAAWQETVRGQSVPWSDLDLRLADTLRVALLEVLLRLTDAAEKERKGAQQRQELLIAELNHRVRNILGLVRGLISQGDVTASVTDFADTLGGRVQALARAHDQITARNWNAASLRGLIAAEAEAYLGGRKDRIVLVGQEVLLLPAAFATLALVFHELVTNAAKYGALVDGSGRVDVEWRFDADGNLLVAWSESGGPAVQPPLRRGFGSTIIERSVPFDLQGQADLDFALTGLRVRLLVPAAHVRAGSAAGALAAAAVPAVASAVALDGPALVVEDNMIIALDAEEMLARLGAASVVVAASVAHALQAVDRTRPVFALLDVNLGVETSVPVAARLVQLGVPFAFATGYGEAPDLLSRFPDTPIVTKPYDLPALRIAIAAALRRPGTEPGTGVRR